ncbi:unnamed protein product [Rotaria magnacalcarata]|uniref:Saponin hydrolase n=1 Tax=Rotaria magnacalcarata TaxID=392030 RepID=A0A816WFG2_9BILA|nr:unnamed protein product [Rotaria magnacalcarata]
MRVSIRRLSEESSSFSFLSVVVSSRRRTVAQLRSSHSSAIMLLLKFIVMALFAAEASSRCVANGTDIPPPPEPEPITITELPLPPVTSNDAEGGCTFDINSHGTGCIGQALTTFQSGAFLPDGLHVTVTVNFTGAPAGPDPASIFTGVQLILVKTDGSTFCNGDTWKCITCGVPVENAIGRSLTMDYPQTFLDGKRLLAGTNIVECTSDLIDDSCTPDQVHIYPIRWNTTTNTTGPGGNIRELRLHPDNVHLGFNSFTILNGKMGQYGYIGRLQFDPFPTWGTPLSPRYDLVSVYRLFDPEALQPVTVDRDNSSLLHINPQSVMVGELRGFSGTGREVSYIGFPAESSNIDVFAADLTTGKVRRLTSHPEYVDPMDISPDDQWTVVMDTRSSGRQMFMAGMRGVPPLTDIVSSSATSSTRNNGVRRFFQPYLIDYYGDRGAYFGQKINAAGDGSPGTINDPEWNGMADPKWSLDGTRIVYWQSHTVPPSCGGINSLVCYNSTEPGGRNYRMMLAHLTSRPPLKPQVVEPISDVVPWGVKYEPGSSTPVLVYPLAGNYVLLGKHFGWANVTLVNNDAGTMIGTVSVVYHDFCDDGLNVLTGSEEVSNNTPSPTVSQIDWFSNLVLTGPNNSTKTTSPDGFHLSIDVLINIFDANGTLTTTVNGTAYYQPANRT